MIIIPSISHVIVAKETHLENRKIRNRLRCFFVIYCGWSISLFFLLGKVVEKTNVAWNGISASSTDFLRWRLRKRSPRIHFDNFIFDRSLLYLQQLEHNMNTSSQKHSATVRHWTCYKARKTINENNLFSTYQFSQTIFFIKTTHCS